MKRIRLSIGSWAYCFGPYKDNPVPFETVIDKLGKLGLDGVELGSFPPHPHPAQFDTKAKRAELKKKVADHGLEFSGLAADLWSCPIIPLSDNSKWMSFRPEFLQPTGREVSVCRQFEDDHTRIVIGDKEWLGWSRHRGRSFAVFWGHWDSVEGSARE